MSPVMMRARWATATRTAAPRAEATCNQWVWRTARHYGVSVAQLRMQTRLPEVARRRWVAMLLMRGDGCSLPEIAREVNLCDHTSVLHGIERIGRFPALLEDAERIRAAYERERRVALRIAEGARA